MTNHVYIYIFVYIGRTVKRTAKGWRTDGGRTADGGRTDGERTAKGRRMHCGRRTDGRRTADGLRTAHRWQMVGGWRADGGWDCVRRPPPLLRSTPLSEHRSHVCAANGIRGHRARRCLSFAFKPTNEQKLYGGVPLVVCSRMRVGYFS